MDDWRVLVGVAVMVAAVIVFGVIQVRLLVMRFALAVLQIEATRDVAIAQAATVNRPQLPNNTHYSPTYHVQYQLTGQAPERALAAPPDPVVQEAPALPTLPGITTLGQVMAQGWRPSGQGVLLALGAAPAGHLRPIVTPVQNKMVHVILCGATGAGKTNILRLLLAQLVAIGHRVYLCNVKYTPVHPDTGEDWRPIVARTVPGRALTDLGEQVELLRSLAEEEMPARLARFNAGQAPGEPIHVALDEIPAIVAHDKHASEYIAALLRMGRELRIDLILVSQDVLVSTLGGNSGHRAQMQTRYCGPGDRTSFQVLIQKEVPGRTLPPPPLEPGVLYLYSAVLQEPELVRVPLVTNEDLYTLLGHPPATNMATDAATVIDVTATTVATPAPAPVATEKPEVADVAISEDAKRALELFLRGLSVAEIVKAMHDVSSNQGATYQKRATEVQDLLRQAFAGR